MTEIEWELLELDDSWAPWKAQINRYTDDGKDYGCPGRRIRTSMWNFLSIENARKVFDVKTKSGQPRMGGPKSCQPSSSSRKNKSNPPPI